MIPLKVKCVTNHSGSYIHRFYDTSPISPSGNFIVVTKLPYENQRPVPGDEAEVQVVEINSNQVVFSFKTKAWDTQLGCQAQWGASDSVLLFNAMGDNWVPHGIKANIFSKEILKLDFTVYMASNDGEYILSPNLMKIGQVQLGYGIRTPFDNQRKHAGAPKDDGLFITSVVDGSTRLLLPLSKLYKLFLNDNPKYDPEKGSLYGFHAKWSPNDQKIMFIARWKFEGEKHTDNFLFTFDKDGTNIKLAITPARWKGGHHPNWCNDSEHIVMNLMYKQKSIFSKADLFLEKVARKFQVRYFSHFQKLLFSKIKFDGSEIVPISKKYYGSGHPSMCFNDRYLLSDAYPNEIVANSNGTVPLRLLDTQKDTLDVLIELETRPDFNGVSNEWRIDPHPAFSRQFDRVIFNAKKDGSRKVFIMDLKVNENFKKND